MNKELENLKQENKQLKEIINKALKIIYYDVFIDYITSPNILYEILVELHKNSNIEKGEKKNEKNKK